jgi:opacity protein-like surface antigen
MKKQLARALIVAFSSMLFAARDLSVCAQTVPSASSGQFSLTVGALGSVFQPDYAGTEALDSAENYYYPIAQTSPNRLYGIGFYVDAKFTRWIQIEGEGRWLNFNEYEKISENNYLIGPRIPIHSFRLLRATPYGKVLFGVGTLNFQNKDAWGRYADIAYGGGVDFKLTKRISARGDFEYQQWPNWPDFPYGENTSFRPYGASVGVSYRILGGRH